MDNTQRGNSPHEDPITSTIETHTKKVPSGAFLTAALATMATSAVLRWAGKKELALFIGEWAPAILVMGVYNKMVKHMETEGEMNGSSRRYSQADWHNQEHGGVAASAD